MSSVQEDYKLQIVPSVRIKNEEEKEDTMLQLQQQQQLIQQQQQQQQAQLHQQQLQLGVYIWRFTDHNDLENSLHLFVFRLNL